MRLRSDFSQRVVVSPGGEDWHASPMPGVERLMLDRIGEEVARATSIVRYAPNSRFSSHTHSGGEEFLVLEGTFNDEHGSYPKGTYVRNPIGTSHSPYVGEDGCTILVKLHQFDERDDTPVNINTDISLFRPGAIEGLNVLPLHTFGLESVALVRWSPNIRFNRHAHWGGEEIYVLEGTLKDEHGVYPAGTWIRSPHMSEHAPFTGPADGALIFVKTGHLPAT